MNIGLDIHQARRWVFLVLVPALIVGSLAYVYTKHQPQVYQATATLYVQQASGTTGGGVISTDIPGSTLLAQTYSQMITDPVILTAADRALATKYPGYHLKSGEVSTVRSQHASTQLIGVTVDDTIPTRAAAAANAVAKAFIQRITQLQEARFTPDMKTVQNELNKLQSQIQRVTQQISSYNGSKAGLNTLETQLNYYQSTYQSLLGTNAQFKLIRDATLSAVSVYSPATVPKVPSGPHPIRTAGLATLIALLLCAVGVYVYDYFDDSLRMPEEVEEIIGAPILGTIQRFDTKRLGTTLVTAKLPRSPLAEAYRLIRTNIQFTNIDKPVRTLLVTSASPQEGKSTTISNLAHVFAEGGLRVTVVDTDLRRPSLHRIFNTDGSIGVTTLLVSEQLDSHGVQPTEHPNLALIASGPIPPNPADLLGSQRMRAIVTHERQRSDIVLMDSPPILAVPDAALLATMAEGVVLVLDPTRTKRRDLRRARATIEGVGGKIIGIIINRVHPRGIGYYYYYYQYYHYGYQFGYTPKDVSDRGSNNSTDMPKRELLGMLRRKRDK
jgi:succinoglycan biosynthesis transport protein ExoP